LRNLYKTKELKKSRVVAKNATTAADGKVYQVEYYNLDAIVSVVQNMLQRITSFVLFGTMM
jgi:hypothetical protein